MKKNFKYAILSAIALVGAVSFSACQSSDEIIDNPNYNSEDNTVKTEFTISLPSNAKSVTRMASTEVPDNNVFRGMEQIVLIPFDVNGVIASTSKRLNSNITLPATNPNTIGKDELVANNNSKLFTNVRIPIGTSSFLLYGKAIDGTTVGNTPSTDADMHKYGILIPSNLTGEPSSFSFTPKQIYTTTGTPAKATAIADYLTDIASASYTEGTTIYKWSESGNTGLKALYDAFVANTAGSSNSVKSFVADLYNSLWSNTDEMSKAIVAKIKTLATPPTTPDGTIASWDTSIDNYPTDINLPDGAAAVTFTSGAFAPANGTIYNTSLLTDYVYPASLYYYVNSQIKTDNETKIGEYVSTNTTWAAILAKYGNDNASVQPNTRSVAIKNPINYGVGRFDMTIKTAAAELFDYRGKAVDVTNGFTVKAVFVGGQKAVGFDFKPDALGSGVIYDNAITAGTKATTTASTANRTLVLETYPTKDINVVVELVNDCGDFYGHGGQLIKAGSTFYMLGQLSAAAASETNQCVFMQDYVTTANFTIKAGTASPVFDPTNPNEEGLGDAYNVIPDLRTPQMELGMSVDLKWEVGHVYDIEL